MSRGQLVDTYVAALQHGTVELPGDPTLVGVVRRPTAWFHASVDENVPALGPPASLLTETKRTAERLESEGVSTTEAHNRSWEETAFSSRYREYLSTDETARAAIVEVRKRLAAGESLALVCYENTEEKRCHRTILRDVILRGPG